MTPSPQPSTSKTWAAVIMTEGLLLLITYLLSATEYWHFAYAHSSHFSDLYNYQRDIFSGHTEWLADQNRVLGPLLILAFMKIFSVGYENAYHQYLFFSFVLMNVTSLFLFRQQFLTAFETGVGLILAASIPLLLVNYWWFPWTNLEAALLLAAFALESERRTVARHVLTGLIFVGLVFTKETAAILAVWVMFRYGLPALARRQWGSLARTTGISALMVGFSVTVVAMLRHYLWVSGSNPNMPSGLPGNIPEFYGTHLLIFASGVLDYYTKGLAALASFRLPWSIGDSRHWPDWPAGLIDFLVMLTVSLSGFVWAVRQRAFDILALALTALVYLAICFALVNMPESDKLMPGVSMGLAAYALMLKRRRSVAADAPPCRVAGQATPGARTDGDKADDNT